MKLEMHRLPDQPPHFWPAAKKGVIRYTLVNTSKTYQPNGLRERTRRMRQAARIAS